MKRGAKRRLRDLLDRGARASGILALLEARARRALTVLMHHRVLTAPERARSAFPSLAMPEEHFEAEARWLARHCEVLPLGSALERLARGPRPRRPLVALTFDDGYRDNFERAAPILERHGLRASFFVTSAFLGAREPLWFDRAAHLLRHASAGAARSAASMAGVDASMLADPQHDLGAWVEALKSARPARRARLLAELEERAPSAPPCADWQPMSRDQVRELAQRGHEIGSHARTHPLLPQLSDAELEEEVRGSRAELEQWIGAPVRGFCYPNGDCDARCVEAVRAAGYDFACTTRPGFQEPGADPFLVPRIDLTQERVSDAAGRFDPLALRAELCAFHELLR